MVFKGESEIRPCPVCQTADNVAGVVTDGGTRPLYWECWECGTRWHLWRAASRKAAQAEGYRAKPYVHPVGR